MSFLDDLKDDVVQSLPLRNVIAVRPYTVVRAAVAMMRHQQLGCAVIVEHGQTPSGIFTEHSLIQMLAQGKCLDECAVCDYVDTDFIVVKESEPISRVWDAVQLAAARFVCVTDDQGEVVGLTGQRGLAEYLADCFASEVAVQRLGSTPWMQQREGA